MCGVGDVGLGVCGSFGFFGLVVFVCGGSVCWVFWL